jgi:hypothetical protein
MISLKSQLTLGDFKGSLLRIECTVVIFVLLSCSFRKGNRIRIAFNSLYLVKFRYGTYMKQRWEIVLCTRGDAFSRASEVALPLESLPLLGLARCLHTGQAWPLDV